MPVPDAGCLVDDNKRHVVVETQRPQLRCKSKQILGSRNRLEMGGGAKRFGGVVGGEISKVGGGGITG